MDETTDRHEILKDRLFWTSLAYTACGILREADDKTQHRFWIDDFLPESATDTKSGVSVLGTAWVGDSPRGMQPFRFIVSIPQKMLHRRRDKFSVESFVLDEEQHTLHVVIGNKDRVV